MYTVFTVSLELFFLPSQLIFFYQNGVFYFYRLCLLNILLYILNYFKFGLRESN